VAPSTRAASSISSGTDNMYWRMKKMPNALAAPGTINGHGVSIHEKVFRIMMNRGTMTTANGIAIVASMRLKSMVRPGKRNFAKAYPPKAHRNTDKTVAVVAMKRLFQILRSASLCSNNER
jgi:hypothetical protein